jgi:hypothetical protein
MYACDSRSVDEHSSWQYVVCMNMLVCQADQSRIRIRAHGPYFHLTRFLFCCQFHGDNYLILIGRVISPAYSINFSHNSDQAARTP